jgi:hypothetical protein
MMTPHTNVYVIHTGQGFVQTIHVDVDEDGYIRVTEELMHIILTRLGYHRGQAE